MLSNAPVQNSKPETGYHVDLATPGSWASERPREVCGRKGDLVMTS